MSNYGSVYRTFLKEPNTCGKNIRISNTANAPVENIFKFIKNDKPSIKIPLVTFISNIAHNMNTLCKEFIHGIITNIDNGNGNFTKKIVKIWKKIKISNKQIPEMNDGRKRKVSRKNVITFHIYVNLLQKLGFVLKRQKAQN